MKNKKDIQHKNVYTVSYTFFLMRTNDAVAMNGVYTDDETSHSVKVSAF